MSLNHQYCRNDVLLRDDGTQHRLIDFGTKDENGNVVRVAWLIQLGVDKALPYPVHLNALADIYSLPSAQSAGQESEANTGTALQPQQRRRPSKASLRVAERAHTRITPLIDAPGIYEPSSRNSLLLEHSKVRGRGTPQTLLRDLRRWWQGGQTLDALTGSYAKCGKPRGSATERRGRLRNPKSSDALTSDTANLRPYQLEAADLAYMRKVIENYFFDKTVRRTLQATLQHLHHTHYTYVDGNGAKCLKPASECPSYRQLDYFLKSNYSLETRLTERKGEKRFAQEDRPTLGSIQIECHGAAHLYEIDATIVDVKLVSSMDRARIVGKPTLYLIIDRETRLIVGFYIGFENASYTAAMQAILSIGEDKEQLCRRLGLPYDPADWPAHGVLPSMFLADQGELMSKKARRIANSMRTTICNVPGLRPEWKPLVECGFKKMHQILAADTPAYVPDADTKKRRAVNRDKDASLNIHEFTTLIVAAIIAHNKTMQVEYPLSIEQVNDGVPPIPRELWSHSIQRRVGLPDRMDFHKVRDELMPRGTATVTGDGVLYERMHFTCPEAESRGWFIEGRKARKPLEIAFDYRLVDEIIVFSPDGSGESFVAHLTKDSVKFRGLTFKEVKEHFASVDRLTEDALEVKRQSRFDYSNQTQPVIAKARAETKEASAGISRSGRRKDVATARGKQLKDEHSMTAGVRMPSQKAAAMAEVNALPTASGKVVALRSAQTSVASTSSSAPPTSPSTATRTSTPTTASTSSPVSSPASSTASPISRELTLKERMAQLRRSM